MDKKKRPIVSTYKKSWPSMDLEGHELGKPKLKTQRFGVRTKRVPYKCFGFAVHDSWLARKFSFAWKEWFSLSTGFTLLTDFRWRVRGLPASRNVVFALVGYDHHFVRILPVSTRIKNK